MGSIIHAYEGTIEVEVERFWGWGFADWQGQDWANACIGSTTILNRSVEPQHLVAAGSRLETRVVELATQQGQPLVLVSPPHLIRGSIPNDRSGNGKR